MIYSSLVIQLEGAAQPLSPPSVPLLLMRLHAHTLGLLACPRPVKNVLSLHALPQ